MSTKEADGPEAKGEGEAADADAKDDAQAEGENAEARGEEDARDEAASDDDEGDDDEGDDDEGDDDEEGDDEDEASDADDEDADDEDADDEDAASEPAAAAAAKDEAEARDDAPKKLTPGERLALAKAKKAKKKAQKRGRQAELVEGRVLKQAERASGWAHENRNLLIAALVVVAVVAVGGTWWYVERQSNAAEAATALWDAVEASRAVIQPEGNTTDDPDDDREVFESREAQSEALLERAAEAASKHAGTAPADWARLLEGRAALEAAQWDDARSAFETALAEGDDDPELAAAALEGIAFAYEGEEEWDSAKERYDELKRLADGAYADLADYHLARILLAKGENDEAKELLAALVERLNDPEDDDEEAPELNYVMNQAQIRLMELDPSAVPSSAGSFQGGGGLDSMSPEEIQRLIQQLQSQGGGAPPGPGGE